MRKRLHKAWQNLLFILLIVAIVSSFFWACCLDSDSWIPTVMLGINAAYIMLIAIANDSQRIKDKKRKERKHGTKGKEDHVRFVQGRAS